MNFNYGNFLINCGKIIIEPKLTKSKLKVILIMKAMIFLFQTQMSQM